MVYCSEAYIPRGTDYKNLRIEHQHRCPAHKEFSCLIAKSETKESMELGIIKSSSGNYRKPVASFNSYPTIEKILENDAAEKEKNQPFKKSSKPNSSVYTRDYSPFFMSKELPCVNEKTPHFLANRIPKNSFLMENHYTEHKFMDDHYYYTRSPGRQCIDFFRRIRTATKMLETAEDEL